ncbi:MAG: UvrD-helicase domain-containing protein, partial [Actinobacteria bacterium]|nr:UvrD-helicase domain-containing protein [Actinomycetota bacterium]
MLEILTTKRFPATGISSDLRAARRKSSPTSLLSSRTAAYRLAGPAPPGALRPAHAAARGPRDVGRSAYACRVTVTAASALLDDLNPQQRAAVEHEGGPLLIVAGAGSGKTRVLTRRIAYLLAERQVAPWEILAITFTNKAAGEMAARAASLTGARARAMWVMTFHSACVRILRREATRFGYPSSFSIYDQADSQRLMAIACRELDLDARHHPPKGMLAQVSTLKNELIDHETFAARAAGYREKALAEAYGEYQRRLAA